MKVKEMIEKLKEFDDDLEVMTLNMYREEIMPVTSCTLKYETLDKRYVYII